MSHRRVEEWWPPLGSCADPACPHEEARRRRDADLERYAQELANDPRVQEELAEFAKDMETLHAGGPDADALRRKWYEAESTANLRLLRRQLQETIAWKARAEAAEAVLARVHPEGPSNDG